MFISFASLLLQSVKRRTCGRTTAICSIKLHTLYFEATDVAASGAKTYYLQNRASRASTKSSVSILTDAFTDECLNPAEGSLCFGELGTRHVVLENSRIVMETNQFGKLSRKSLPGGGTHFVE